METREAIAARRSIRKFKPDPLPDGAVRAILTAAIQAPSAKNRQPWRLTVVSGSKRTEMIRSFREGLDRMEARGESTGSARGTAACMAQAPVTVFVHHPEGIHPWLPRPVDGSWGELGDLQSIGAAIENMLLAAQELGIGSLWIADVWYAYSELNAWLGTDDQLVAAVSFGYAAESPSARPRKAWDEIVREI